MSKAYTSGLDFSPLVIRSVERDLPEKSFHSRLSFSASWQGRIFRKNEEAEYSRIVTEPGILYIGVGSKVSNRYSSRFDVISKLLPIPLVKFIDVCGIGISVVAQELQEQHQGGGDEISASPSEANMRSRMLSPAAKCQRESRRTFPMRLGHSQAKEERPRSRHQHARATSWRRNPLLLH